MHEWHIGRRHPVPTTAWGIPVEVVVVVTIQGATRQTGSIEGATRQTGSIQVATRQTYRKITRQTSRTVYEQVHA